MIKFIVLLLSSKSLLTFIQGDVWLRVIGFWFHERHSSFTPVLVLRCLNNFQLWMFLGKLHIVVPVKCSCATIVPCTECGPELFIPKRTSKAIKYSGPFLTCYAYFTK